MRVAIVHDYLNQRGGAEWVVAVLHEMFPEAPIFTSIVDRDTLWPGLQSADIRPSWMQRLPGLRGHFKKYLLLYPVVFENVDLSGYDLVISSSSAFAKAVRSRPGAFHLCYCHTPARFIWDYQRYVERERFGRPARALLPMAIRLLRAWDLRTADRPRAYVANSRLVAARIRQFYGREAEVVPPPVDLKRFQPLEERGDFYLVVSRLNSYKRIHLAIEAFNSLRLPLIVVGDGPHRAVLERLAGPTIRFTGYLRDEEISQLYGRCQALIFPGEEDFGLTVLEANACGRPVIAYRGGGALETVIPDITGMFFDEPSGAALADGVLQARERRWDSWRIREHAEGYGIERFKEQLGEVFRTVKVDSADGVRGWRATHEVKKR